MSRVSRWSCAWLDRKSLSQQNFLVHSLGYTITVFSINLLKSCWVLGNFSGWEFCVHGSLGKSWKCKEKSSIVWRTYLLIIIDNLYLIIPLDSNDNWRMLERFFIIFLCIIFSTMPSNKPPSQIKIQIWNTCVL